MIKHESTWSQNQKNELAAMAREEVRKTSYGYAVCTLSAEGIETESGEQNVDCLLKDPEMQSLADELGKPVTLTVEKFGLTKIWTPGTVGVR